MKTEEKKSGILIQQMQEADILETALLEAQLFSEPWSAESLRQAALKPSNLYLAVRQNGMLCAYCGLWGVADEGQITNVAVHPEYRRRGIARTMLKELLRQGRAQGLSAFTLEVRAGNVGAIKLYDSLGFLEAGIRKQFYNKPKEDAVIMWLKDRKEQIN